MDREEVTHVVYLVIFPPVSSYLVLFPHWPLLEASLTHVDIPLRGDGRQMFDATLATESVHVQNAHADLCERLSCLRETGPRWKRMLAVSQDRPHRR